MPRPGGEADKLGNRYEGLWTVDAALDLLDGSYTDLTVEVVGDEAAGVEFVRTSPSGIREYHSIKRQHARGNWTLSLLTRRGPTGRSILDDLVVKVRAGNDAVFSSGTSATGLLELIERAKASKSLEEFRRRIAGSGPLSGQFVKYVVPLCDDERAAWTALRRLDVRITDESTLTTAVERRVDSMLRTASGEPIDPRAARLLIGDVLTDPLGKRHTATSLLDALGDHGLLRSHLAGEPNVAEQIQRLNQVHLDEVHALLINRAEIIREESRSAVATLLDGGKSVMLEGVAGGGKSCVLAQVLERLEEPGVACLVIRLDRLDSGVQRAQAIGTRLGLPKSPAITLGEFASGEPSVLVVDQLDAIGVVSARNQSAWAAFNELLGEAASYPNMRILFACRSFDLERDPRLRALVENRGQVERIQLQPLDEGVIKSALAAAGLDPSSLNQGQVEILSTPLHLHLLVESANSGPLEFTSAQDLFDAFWNHKAAVVSHQMLGDSRVWAAAVERLCSALSERETLGAPTLVLDEFGGALDALASEGVVSVHDGQVRFFHESFFDYAFARAFVRSNKDLVQWLLDDEQHLFRRSQVRQVLQFLRGHESDRARYLKTLARLLGHEEIRFHIKKLVLDWLAAMRDPTPDEWIIVEGLADELGGHAWAVVRNSVPWFDVLQDMGRWQAWLEADDGQINRTVGLLGMPEVLNSRSAVIAALVRGFRGASEDWEGRLRWLVRLGRGLTSTEMQDLVINLIADGTLDEARPGIAANDDWWFMWYRLGTEQPIFAIRVLGAWWDRQVARAAILGQVDPFAYDLGLVTRSQNSAELINESAEAAPLQFGKELFQRLAQFDLRVPKEWLSTSSNYGTPDDQIREALADAMSVVAREDPSALDAILDTGTYGESRWMSALLLRVWSANATAYAERIVQFILQCPDQRLDIGYDISMGETDSLVAVSRMAVAAASEHCSEESFAELESTILDFRPGWEQERRAIGRTALALLRALDGKRLSTNARRRIQELERRFPDASERGTPTPPTNDRLWGVVSAPIAPPRQREMTDDQWLGAMRRYKHRREEETRDGRIVGGAAELARGLQELTRADPGRFAGLVTRMEAELHPVYFEAILEGLTSGEKPDRPGTLEDICGVLRHITEIGVEVSEKALADAIGVLADEDVPEDIIQILCTIGANATDPEEDRWEGPGASDSEVGGSRNSSIVRRIIDWIAGSPILGRIKWLRPNPSSGPDKPWSDPIAQASNSSRGTAARSIALLLFADPDRWEVLGPTVERLIVDPVLAIRSVAVECLLAILDTRREAALAGFQRLVGGASAIVGSHLVVRFVHFAMYRDYAAMRPTLLKLLRSGDAAAVKAGAAQMTLASLSIEEASRDGDRVLSFGENARVGAATVYADNVGDPTLGEACEEHLKVLFCDESEAVRRAAARCWDALEPDELARRGSLLGAYVRSISPSDDVTPLTQTLGRAHEPLPPEVCELAERAVSAYGPKAGDITQREAAAAYDLAPLVMRLHEETDDRDLRGRVLDAVDDMLRAGFLGMNDQLGQRYDR